MSGDRTEIIRIHDVRPAPPRPAAAQRIAVVDVGTGSVRATIAELAADGATLRALEETEYPVDLTAGFLAEQLDRAALDGVVDAFEGIVRLCRDYAVERVRAVATTAVREAANSDVLVELLRGRAGIDLEVIDGAEEARLYFEAFRALLARCQRELAGAALLVDIGGGGTSVALIRGGKLVHSVDEHFGTMRVHALFRDLKDSTDFAVTVDRYCMGAARMMLGRLRESRIDHLAIAGSEVRLLQGLLRPEARSPMEPLPVAAVERWFERMQPMTPHQRAQANACDQRTAALLMPAACLIRHLGVLTGLPEVQVPRLNLRDGMLADQLPGAPGPHHLDRSHLVAEAEQLLRRFGGDTEYATNTAALAVQLFDQTAALHRLGERERVLLELAALLHDIGSYINVRNRHKHTMYVIEAADIAGLSSLEKSMVAHVARYHRRSPPRPHHLGFQALPRRERVVVAQLAALLRVAYGLDVERTRRIRRVRCEIVGERLLLHVDRRQIALERWSITEKSGYFAEVFGLDIVLVPREED